MHHSYPRLAASSGTTPGKPRRVSGIVEEAIEQRLDEDDSPGRLRALAAATVVGHGAAVLT